MPAFTGHTTGRADFRHPAFRLASRQNTRLISLRSVVQPSQDRPGLTGVCRLIANHRSSAPSKGVPEVRVLPSTRVTRLHQYYDPVRLPFRPSPEATLRPLPSPKRVSPVACITCFQHAAPITPADQMGAHVDCFPTRAAFPVTLAGRHPHLHFRGLLRLHSRCGLLARSAAQGDLCHEASVWSVTRPPCSSATRPIDSYLGGFFLHW